MTVDEKPCTFRIMRRRVAAVVLAATSMLLTSCSAPAEFAREQTAADRPDAVVDGAAGRIDVATLRYVGTAEVYDVYLARASDDARRSPFRSFSMESGRAQSADRVTTYPSPSATTPASRPISTIGEGKSAR